MRLKWRWLSVIAVLPAASAYGLFGGFPGTIFDPANFVENIRQTLALLQQIDRAVHELTLQAQLLRPLPASVAPEARDGISAVTSAAADHFGVASESVAAVSAALEARFPLDAPVDRPGWLLEQRRAWDQAARRDLIDIRAIQNHVVADMAPTSARLRSLIAASNGEGLTGLDRPGLTAVAQAHNELLALASFELDKLTLLRATRRRAQQLERARDQSAARYSVNRRQRLMADWPIRRERP